MKKLKQITALIGVIALAGLYVSTLVLALIGSEQCINLLKAAVYATIVLPVLLWAYSFIYRMAERIRSILCHQKSPALLIQMLNRQWKITFLENW